MEGKDKGARLYTYLNVHVHGREEEKERETSYNEAPSGQRAAGRGNGDRYVSGTMEEARRFGIREPAEGRDVRTFLFALGRPVLQY